MNNSSLLEYYNIIDKYSNELYYYPDDIHENKIEYLKNHYYQLIKYKISIDRENILLGFKNLPYILYISSKLNPDLHLLFDRQKKKFYIKFYKPIKLIEELRDDEFYYYYLLNNKINNNNNDKIININFKNNNNYKKLNYNYDHLCCVIL
tara:strand:- start:11020 stop:11469 length:450 start_codon:yes stop_codon:yes gene_type:complete